MVMYAIRLVAMMRLVELNLFNNACCFKLLKDKTRCFRVLVDPQQLISTFPISNFQQLI